MERTPVIRMPEESRGVTLKTHPMVFLVTGPETRHTSMFDWTIPPRFETGLHVHRVQEETFYLIEGACVWQVGGREIAARPGTFVFIPPGVPHNITNPNAETARVLMTVSPPGHEQYFEDLARLSAAGAPDPAELHALRERFDTDQLSTLTMRP